MFNSRVDHKFNSMSSIFRIWPKQSPLPQDSFGHVDEAKMIHANLPLMEIHGSIQFKVDTNAHRMIPMANCEDYLYNRGLLQRTREVRSRWCGREVSSFQRVVCTGFNGVGT